MESKNVSFTHEDSVAGVPAIQEMQYTALMTRSKNKKLAKKSHEDFFEPKNYTIKAHGQNHF